MESIFSVWPYMTENKKYGNLFVVRSPLKRFSCLVLLCAVLTLGGCSGFDLPSLPDIPGFGDDDKSEGAEKDMKNEVSYLEEKRKSRGGVNPKNIFGKSLRSDTERMDRLERAVQDLRNEFDQAEPSIRRLTALEGEIQKLIKELKVLNNDTSGFTTPTAVKRNTSSQGIVGFGASPSVTKRANNAPASKATPVKPAPTKAPVKSYQKKSPPNIANGVASVFDVRVGEHPNRTRIVMDVSSTTGFNIDIDNNENIIIIELPQAGWTAAKSKNFAKSNFISSYRVESSESGHMMILQLKRDAKVVYKGDLKSNTGNSRRLVIDLGGV